MPLNYLTANDINKKKITINFYKSKKIRKSKKISKSKNNRNITKTKKTPNNKKRVNKIFCNATVPSLYKENFLASTANF